MKVIFSKDKKIPAKHLIGGKAYGLHELQNILNNVPPWGTLTTSFFEEILKKNTEIHKLITEKDSNTIHKALQSLHFSDEDLIILEDLWNQISKNETISVAVRSSAVDEDSSEFSFAGQMDSFLQITSFQKYLKAIQNCLASFFGERAIAYRKQNGIDPWNVKIAIIVQQMIPAETSGIIFTANPISNQTNEMLITSAYGLGEGLVSGKLDTDTYVLNRKGKVLQQELAEKNEQIQVNEKGGTIIGKIPSERENKPALTQKQLQKLHHLSLFAESKKGIPLDIEFSIFQGQIYFLQARPITSLKKKEEFKIWDNSNIAESYSGITTPLTFSFIQKAYYAVYCQFCKTIGVNQKTIFKNRHILENMLGFIQGRVYYNLLNWYRLVSLMPGFQYNKSFMEEMMGLQVIPEEPINSSSRPKWEKYFFELPRLLRVGVKMIIAHLRLPKEIAKFQSHFNQIYSYYSQMDFSKKSSNELLDIYRKLEEEILWKWQSPITNDFEAMIFYGVLKKLTIKWDIDPNGILQNDLLSGEGNIQSTQLISSLATLSLKIEKDSNLKNEFLTNPPEKILLKLKNHPAFFEINAQFLDYLKKYGVRCINEMKLESIPIKDDPLFCITTIQNYLRNGVPDPAEQQEKEKKLRQTAEKTLHQKLRGKRLFIYKWILKNCRNAIKNRENQRFARSQAYDLVRTLFRSIGKQWENKAILNKTDDIFYLRMEEIFAYIEGTSSCINLKDLILLRKKEFKQYESEHPDDHIKTQGEVYFSNQFSKPPSGSNASVLQGLGCCSGIIEKEIKVVLSPDKDLKLNKEIMVAKQTDPGWGILFPSISGLIIEKGSMLSHSAIVAREMGIPAVIGVKDATKIFANGDRIILDGSKGTIQIVEKKA